MAREKKTEVTVKPESNSVKTHRNSVKHLGRRLASLQRAAEASRRFDPAIILDVDVVSLVSCWPVDSPSFVGAAGRANKNQKKKRKPTKNNNEKHQKKKKLGTTQKKNSVKEEKRNSYIIMWRFLLFRAGEQKNPTKPSKTR